MDVQDFKNTIEDIVDVRIDKKGIVKFISAKVSSINNDGTINVFLPPDENNIITNLLNKTGQTLIIGDSVELCTKNGKIKNSWVSLRHGDNFVAPGGGGTSSSMPIGTIVEFTGDTMPSGWLLCDGAAISRTAYSALFNRIGTTYGAGDGSTTFNLPNFKGRTPVGKDASQTEFDTMGETGGEKTHTLTINEMPSHTHYDGTNGSEGISASTGWNSAVVYYNASSGRPTTSTGGNQPHNNLQPYLVINFIIKATEVDETGNKVDPLPIGSIFDYDGDTVPSGFIELGDTYSTTEQDTGQTWIDGKPIYRKVFEITSGLNPGAIGISTGLSDVETPILLTGFLFRSGGNNMPIPSRSYDDTSKIVSIRNANGPSGITLEIGSSITNATKANIIYEYTKTTD